MFTRYKRYFTEARRNPELNPHIGAWDYLEQYKDDPDVYISFTEIDKIGINPRSKYNTPVGIYSYPLKEFFEKYLHNGKIEQNKKFQYSIGHWAPFAGNSKYINFIKVKDKANFINDMYKDYGSSDYDKDIKILRKKYATEFYINWKNNKEEIKEGPLGKSLFFTWDNPSLTQIEKFFNSFVDLAVYDAKDKNPIMSMWNIVRLLAINITSTYKAASTKWNLILNKDLGYSGFADKSGKGYIHESEPMQAVFLNTRAFTLLHRVENIPAKKVVVGGNLKISNIEVLKIDAPVKLDWDGANKYCKTLGGKWRLPSKGELNLIYKELHKKGLGGFVIDYYWSSSESDEDNAWSMDFGDGTWFNYYKNYGHYVRPVRNI